MANKSEQKCYDCKYLIDAFGNYVMCKKSAENGTQMFVDWYYWNDGSPEKCPLKKVANQISS